MSLYRLRIPRHAAKVEHDLVELLVVAVNAGADTFVEIELWAREKLDWLRGSLKLEHGIPSHDTFGRLFGLIDPEQFISSLAPDAQRIAHAVRSHWSVENRLHWCMDVAFNDDQMRAPNRGLRPQPCRALRLRRS